MAPFNLRKIIIPGTSEPQHIPYGNIILPLFVFYFLLTLLIPLFSKFFKILIFFDFPMCW